MSGFLYFIPGLRSSDAISRGRLAANLVPPPILAALQDCDQVPDQTIALDLDHGPDGGPGLLLIPKPVDAEIPPRLGYSPEVQSWIHCTPQSSPHTPCADSCGTRSVPATFWLGYTTGEPPVPADLERRETIPGYLVSDESDLSWSIPTARAVENPRGNLPYAVRWDGNFRPYCGVSERYAAFWEDSGRLWDLVDQHGTPDTLGFLWLTHGLTEEEDSFVLRVVVQALATNYRVGPAELSTLNALRPGWLSVAAASRIANAVVDYHARRRWELAQKKTVTPPTPVGVSSPPGESVATPPFAPAEASLQ